MPETSDRDARRYDADPNRTPTHPSPEGRAAPTPAMGTDDTTDAETRRYEAAHTEHRDDSIGRETRIVTTDPSLDQHQRAGISGATWIALILGTLILILLLIFILQNNVSADFAYFGWQFSLPLGIAMLFAAIAGVLVTALLGSVRLFKVTRRMRRLEKERESIKRAIG